MKKYLLSALALPLLFACSSDDLIEQEAISNDPFAGIEKVDATFSMADEGLTTRMATDWELEEGDVYGLAWLQDGLGSPVLTLNGNAYQNHNLTQEDYIFKPATSIYTGKYYLYRPYDYTTVEPGAINFKSLEEQTLTDGQGGDAWKALAKTAIIIGDKWTTVTKTGTTDASGKVWDKAGLNEDGTKQNYNIYAAVFSNQTGLDLTYVKNNPSFTAATPVAGATDISYTYAAGTSVGAADIYSATVTLAGAAKSFTYAPTSEPMTTAGATSHNGTFWADKKDLATNGYTGFTFTNAAITLTAADENGVSTDKTDNKGWFWFNSLPVTAGNATSATTVTSVFETSYGTVTINTSNTLGDVAYEYNNFGTASNPDWQWVKLVAGTTDNLTTSPKQWAIDAGAPAHNTFVNQYGNHHGKYAFSVDFSQGAMNGMHIKNDAHLQKLLKYYIASGKTETPVSLNLDADANGEFKISKISIALLQTINATGKVVKVHACTTHGTPKIIVTQEGQSDLGLSDKTEVPALNNVFDAVTDVYLASGATWTWAGNNGTNNDGTDPLPIDANVNKLVNEGTLTVNATNIQTNPSNITIINAAGATMNITQVTTVKNHLRNEGTLNVGSETNTSAELRAYGKVIANQATSLTAYGTLNNYGVIGVTAGTGGIFRNFGLINMMNDDAITLLTVNASNANSFGTAWSTTNKMGTVVLPEGNPYALVSVSNGAETGFIKYNWTGSTYTHDAGNVKYNTLVVSNDIEFTGAAATEIQYLEFNGTRTKVVNPTASDKLTNLKGVIVNDNKSIIIEKTNQLVCGLGAYLGDGATVYKGGIFTYVSTTNYLGTWSTTQIVEY